ncbi:Xaa-Pro aminopeptidase [Hahella chejuensis KCTC 2396]|uniref:Xaa-Pro aminopeptidase n=1 Tax=Hahella chejuensis (strain KCTC 2396) TaxID=349521 RepID=Q2SHI8_HAHCH|nr:aminopeptidase P family protein [Hahella chejuensis]ABC29886.1 Xaa-Pro aminopeptidase [Hahella chejuensis KCTC 2396]
MNTPSVTQRLDHLRKAMKAHAFAAYIVTNNDPHSSEYSADHWLARAWISGFNGSAGNVVVTGDGGGLWTDGRYFIQAEEQLAGSGLRLFKAKLPETPTIAEWLAATLPEQSRVGVDGRSISRAFYQELMQAFAPKSIQLILDQDLITPLWYDRPARPKAPVFNHDLRYAGVDAQEKIQRIRQWMAEQAVDALLVSNLDNVMWTLNIRGGDTPYCPISESYLLVSAQQSRVFIDREKLPEAVECTLAEYGVTAHDYDQIADALAQLPEGCRLSINPASANSLLVNQAPSSVSLVETPCPVTDMKAQKNPTEMENFEQVLRLDGVAMVNFMYWLQAQVPGDKVTELSAEKQLREYRRATSSYISDSFRTIAGFGPHAAKMHYSATADSNATVDESNFFLVDSGGQYPGGTTDITRTFHFGAPTAQQRKDYTLVLKAVIRLTQTVFLKGATGANLDIMARGMLWRHGIDYKCGTGHGVGLCLNVHEGPQNFSQNPKEVALKPGMVITNEPGVYREGEYGVRIENIMKVVELEENEFGVFYGFETITLAPIAVNALDLSMLSAEETDWLNAYHWRVYEALSPYLEASQTAWLRNATKPI